MPQGTQAAGRWGHMGSPGRAQDGQDAPGPAALPTGDQRRSPGAVPAPSWAASH